MVRQTSQPDSLFDSQPYGYSQVTIGEGTKIVTISGQVALDKDLNLIGDDLATQAMQTMENIKLAIEAVGGSLDDILSLRVYVVDAVMRDDGVQEAIRKYFPDSPPTLTWIGIASLARPDYLIEIEAMAVLA